MPHHSILSWLIAALLVLTHGLPSGAQSNRSAHNSGPGATLVAQALHVELPCSDRAGSMATLIDAAERSPLPQTDGDAPETKASIDIARRATGCAAFERAQREHQPDAHAYLRGNGSANAHGART